MNAQPTIPGDIVWYPSADDIENAHLTQFIRQHEIDNLDELLYRSTSDIAWFTQAILAYLNIEFYEPYTQVVDLSKGYAWPQWVVGGKMNIVHNCIDKYIGSPNEHLLAFIWEGEEGETQAITYKQLHKRVNQAANALRALGLAKGDVIGLYMPMTPEIVIALLAIAKIGGIILPLFSGFGSDALATRLRDADAKALFTADGAFRRGKAVKMKDIADIAASHVPTLQHMIVQKRANLKVKMVPGRDHWWHETILSQSNQAQTEITSAEDTLMIIYTSGTTGLPKGAVHSHAGFPVKASQDMAFGTDVHPNDVIYWITDMGWMMGPWLVFGSLILGSTFLIYDGAPDYPGPERIWAMVERHKITTLGVSPTLIRALMPHGEAPFRQHDLSSLRLFASTGEPWNPDPWWWLFEKIGRGTRPIINYSGGTELSGGILMGNLLRPIKPCALSSPCPGIAADVFDEEGKPVRNQVGELVIKAPWIGMTRGFWKDRQRYEQTYWSRWEDIWVHGDFAFVDDDGMWFILGRSDDTIKVAGKRIGPAEVESVLVSHPAVVEAAAIGVPDKIKGNAVIAFCVILPEYETSETLRTALESLIINSLGKPLAPRRVLFVSDLPKTRNAKVMRRMIRAAYLGADPGDTSSLVNPKAVEEIISAR
jgi:acetyl-CoA synthetase